MPKQRSNRAAKTVESKNNHWFWALAVLVVLLSCLAVGRGTMQMIWAQEELSSIEEVNDGLRARNSVLMQKVQHLRTNRQALESVIRQDLGMVKAGEVVYLEPGEAVKP